MASFLVPKALRECQSLAQPCLRFSSQKPAVKLSRSHGHVGRGLAMASTHRRRTRSVRRGEHPLPGGSTVQPSACGQSAAQPGLIGKFFLEKGGFQLCF